MKMDNDKNENISIAVSEGDPGNKENQTPDPTPYWKVSVVEEKCACNANHPCYSSPILFTLALLSFFLSYSSSL
jgi:hypothetical protein